MCPTPVPRVTYCPLCRASLSDADVAASPPGDYPSHYACRIAFQADIEECDLIDQEQEYRRQCDRARSEESP